MDPPAHATFPPLAELLPHSPPMILLDTVVDRDERSIACAVRVRPDMPFARDGHVPALLAIEYMAQAVAAYAGLLARDEGRPIRIGYLLGTRELTLDVERFDVGDELIVRARHVWGDATLGTFDCDIDRAGTRSAAATLNVYAGKLD